MHSHFLLTIQYSVSNLRPSVYITSTEGRRAKSTNPNVAAKSNSFPTTFSNGPAAPGPNSIARSQQSPLLPQGVGYNFDFKLAYKFLQRTEARLRYGNTTVGAWRGDRVPGTYCDRILTDCDLRACRIQSPNFPGVYPRNATCNYRIEHTKVSVTVVRDLRKSRERFLR